MDAKNESMPDLQEHHYIDELCPPLPVLQLAATGLSTCMLLKEDI